MWALENRLYNEHLVTVENIDESTSQLLSRNGHILYLYTPETDKYKIYAQFLSDRNTNAVLITDENLEKTKEILKGYGVEKLAIANPSLQNIAKFLCTEGGGREERKGGFKTIIVDCTSSVQQPSLEPVKPLKYGVIHKRKKIGYNNKTDGFLNYKEREKFLSKLDCDSILCMYDITKLSRNECRRIIEKHSKAVIIKDSNMLVTESFSSNITNGFLEKFVKNELETIILSLVSKEPMCGTDIKKSVYENFHVLLSSGTLYPLLHKLEKEGFLQSKLGFEKVKMYTVTDREKVSNRVNDHMQAKNFLNMFVRSNMRGVQRMSVVYKKKE